MRYAGSKWKIAKWLARLIPPGVRHFYEPCCGSFAFFRRLMSRGHPLMYSSHLNDANHDLYRWILALRGDLTSHGDFIERHRDIYARLMPENEHETEIKAFFEECKSLWLDTGDYYAWYFLHCYALGQFVQRQRANTASIWCRNLNNGIRADPPKKFEQWRKWLQHAEITNRDCLEFLSELNTYADPSHLVYLDTPYPVDGTTRLYQNEMSFEYHRDLHAFLKTVSFRLMMSLGDYPLTRELYISDKAFYCLPVYYSTNNRKKLLQVGGRAQCPKTKEWVILNYDLTEGA